MLIFLFYAERSIVNVNSVLIMIRKMFKKFCLLKKNIDNLTIDSLMECDFAKRAGEIIEMTILKWEARKKNQELLIPKKQLPKLEKSYYPRELQELLNLKTALCPSCKSPFTSLHLNTYCMITIPLSQRMKN